MGKQKKKLSFYYIGFFCSLTLIKGGLEVSNFSPSMSIGVTGRKEEQKILVKNFRYLGCW